MNQKPKRRLLVLSSLALVGATTLATSFALMNNYQDQPAKDPLVSSINQRNITDNITMLLIIINYLMIVILRCY